MESEAAFDAMIATFERSLEGKPGYAVGLTPQTTRRPR